MSAGLAGQEANAAVSWIELHALVVGLEGIGLDNLIQSAASSSWNAGQKLQRGSHRYHGILSPVGLSGDPEVISGSGEG